MNQKPINSPSKPRVSTIVLCARQGTVEAVDTLERCVQLITDERQRCYEPDACDEAKDFGDECVEAAEDEQAAEDRGTDITTAENRRRVTTLHDGMAARRGINGHAQYGAPAEYCL